jgi:uncharacterized membrane protein YjjP (DUF1212 family)
MSTEPRGTGWGRAAENAARSLRRIKADRRYATWFAAVVVAGSVPCILGGVLAGFQHFIPAAILFLIGLSIAFVGGLLLNREGS